MATGNDLHSAILPAPYLNGAGSAPVECAAKWLHYAIFACTRLELRHVIRERQGRNGNFRDSLRRGVVGWGLDGILGRFTAQHCIDFRLHLGREVQASRSSILVVPAHSGIQASRIQLCAHGVHVPRVEYAGSASDRFGKPGDRFPLRFLGRLCNRLDGWPDRIRGRFRFT